MLKALGGKFKSVFERPNYSGRYTAQEYYEKFYVPKSLVELDEFLNSDGCSFVTSPVNINFKNVDFGVKIKKVIKSLGKPLYRINNHEIVENHEIIFYKYDFGGFKLVAQLHFLDKVFFLGQYLFDELNNAKFESVKLLISQKYQINPEIDLNNIVIRDSQNNKITVLDDSCGMINYISGNEQISQAIKEQIASVKAQEVLEFKQEINQLIENL